MKHRYWGYRNNNIAIFHLKVDIFSSAIPITGKHMLISNVIFTGEEKIHRRVCAIMLSFDLERECRHETRNYQKGKKYNRQQNYDMLSKKHAIKIK